jgi:uncharacterized protein (DUF1697 family)
MDMAALRTVVATCGYADVRTYINSGNVVLSADGSAADVEREMSAAIEREFGFAADVFVRTGEELATVVAGNPWPDGDPSRVNVAFLHEPPSATVNEALGRVAAPQESYAVAGREIYVHYRQGQARSKLAATFADVIAQTCTVRNVRTVEKVAELCCVRPG